MSVKSTFILDFTVAEISLHTSIVDQSIKEQKIVFLLVLETRRH